MNKITLRCSGAVLAVLSTLSLLGGIEALARYESAPQARDTPAPTRLAARTVVHTKTMERAAMH